MRELVTERLKLAELFPDLASKYAQKLHRKKDELECVRKFYAAEKSDVDDSARTIVATVSTSDEDRDGERVLVEGIDMTAYAKNPLLCWQHRSWDLPPIGKSLWQAARGNRLIMKFQFASTQFADEIYQLYKGGYLSSFSISFIPLDFDRKERIHKRVELIEVSAVNIPSNRSATVIQEAFQKGFITSPQLLKDFDIDIEIDEPDDLDIDIEPPDPPAKSDNRFAVIQIPEDLDVRAVIDRAIGKTFNRLREQLDDDDVPEAEGATGSQEKPLKAYSVLDEDIDLSPEEINRAVKAAIASSVEQFFKNFNPKEYMRRRVDLALDRERGKIVFID